MRKNYYLLNPDLPHVESQRSDPRIHIGKKSAAGFYCFDCDRPLWIGPIELLHFSEHARKFRVKRCPTCGQEPEIEPLSRSSVGRELGFNKMSYPQVKTGVKSTSSFSWAMTPEFFDQHVGEFVWNEYGDQLSVGEFRAILKECKIHLFRFLNVEFS